MNKRVVINIHMILLIIGIFSIVFYFLHVILGSMSYPGYDFLSQAVSDLTSDDSPSKEIARTFSTLYGVFSGILSIGLFYTFRKESYRLLKLGIYLIGMMYLVSAVGYGLFPLSSDPNINNFQNIMHIVVTILVVLLTIASLILLMISFKKKDLKVYFILTLMTFLILMIGSIATGLVPAAYFGLAERFGVFSVVIYIGVISYFNYEYHQIKKMNN